MSGEKSQALVNSVKSVSRETFDRLTVFHDLLRQWQARINLIAPSTIDHIWERHIADSLQCCKLIGDRKHVLDIGSGAGFPGMVLAMAMAENGSGKVDLVESNGKKCAFLNAVIRATGLRNTGVDIQVHDGRIEEVLPNLHQPDVITARALASLSDLLRLTDPLLRKDAIGVFQKGRDHNQEVLVARQSWAFECESQASLFEAGSAILKIAGVKPL